jgi:hypothetical protein
MKRSFFVKYYSIAFAILPGKAGGLAVELYSYVRPSITKRTFHCGGLDLFPKPPTLPTLCFKTPSSQHVGGIH